MNGEHRRLPKRQGKPRTSWACASDPSATARLARRRSSSGVDCPRSRAGPPRAGDHDRRMSSVLATAAAAARALSSDPPELRRRADALRARIAAGLSARSVSLMRRKAVPEARRSGVAGSGLPSLPVGDWPATDTDARARSSWRCSGSGLLALARAKVRVLLRRRPEVLEEALPRLVGVSPEPPEPTEVGESTGTAARGGWLSSMEGRRRGTREERRDGIASAPAAIAGENHKDTGHSDTATHIHTATHIQPQPQAQTQPHRHRETRTHTATAT